MVTWWPRNYPMLPHVLAGLQKAPESESAFMDTKNQGNMCGPFQHIVVTLQTLGSQLPIN